MRLPSRFKLICSLILGFQTVMAGVPSYIPACQTEASVNAVVVEKIAETVANKYFDQKVGCNIAEHLRKGLANGSYDNISSPQILAEQLTKDMYELTHDRHLLVKVISKTAIAPTKSQISSRQEQAVRENYGIPKVEILPGNIGYIVLTAFYRPEEAWNTIRAALCLVNNTDALIIDLRNNGGGSPVTLNMMISQIINLKGTPIFEIIQRDSEPVRYITESSEKSYQLEKKPVFILTSKNTYSAGEGLAFFLQEHHRAIIIGESSAGASNRSHPYSINQQYEVSVSNGAVRSLLTGKNWEGVGVIPDISSMPSDAPRVAHIHALQVLIQKAPPGLQRDKLQQQLDETRKQPMM